MNTSKRIRNPCNEVRELLIQLIAVGDPEWKRELGEGLIRPIPLTLALTGDKKTRRTEAGC